jgi:hypothetical protein
MSNMAVINKTKLQQFITREIAILQSMTDGGASGNATKDVILSMRILAQRAKIDALDMMLESLE